LIPSELHNKRILFSALNWGMGHVSRSIGLIQELEKNGNTIVIACNDSQKLVFEEYFPNISIVNHDGYPFSFKGKGNFEMDLMRSFLKLHRRMKREIDEVEEFVKENKVDLIISDHRYGFRSENIQSVFITHQLNLPVKWYASFVQKWHERLMKKFDAIWVMDSENSALAGELSKNIKELNVNYIGPYSRFMFQHDNIGENGKTVLIVSGPEVYARQFIEERLPLLKKAETQIIAASSIGTSENWIRVSNRWKEQDLAILNASKIISRSGYSTIMDLHFLQKPFDLHPTKGQAEQEYLAKVTGVSES